MGKIKNRNGMSIMPVITFIFGAFLGALSGLLFHRWWITPDIKDMKKHIKKLETDVQGLSKLALRGFKVSRYKNGVQQEDEIIDHYKNKTEEN